MSLDYGSVQTYSPRGFGFVGRTLNSGDEVFFHIKTIKRKYPELAQKLDAACLSSADYRSSALDSGDNQTCYGLSFWYRAEDTDSGDQVVDVWLRAEDIPRAGRREFADHLKFLWEEGSDELPEEIHAFTKLVLGQTAYEVLSGERERRLLPIREQEAERKRLAEESQRRHEEVRRYLEARRREKLTGLREIETRVVGVTHGNRQSVISELIKEEEVWLRREPDNPYDGNAIRVERADGQQIGYISRYEAAEYASAFDLYGQTVAALVTEIAPGLGEYSSVGVRIRFRVPARDMSKLKVGEAVWLRRELDDPDDGNAIRIERKDGQQIGYLSRDAAAKLASAFDADERPVAAEVTDVVGGPGVYKLVCISYQVPRRDVSELKVGEVVWLRREPDNPDDGNAIRVERKDGQQVGYLSRDAAAVLASAFDAHGRPVAAEVTGVVGGPGVHKLVRIRYQVPRCDVSELRSLEAFAPCYVNSIVTQSRK